MKYMNNKGKKKTDIQPKQKNKKCECIMCCILGYKQSLASWIPSSINSTQPEQPPAVAYISNEPYFVYL